MPDSGLKNDATMKTATKILWLLMMAAFLYGCRNTTSQPSNLPDIGVPITEINSRISLSTPRAINTFKIGDEIAIAVEVLSADKIAFKHDYGARIFMHDGSEWKEVKNYMGYTQGDIVLETRSTNPLNIGAAIIYPYLPNQTKAVTLRVFIIGNIYKNGEITPEETAGFLDVNLKP